jgi:hypothetical protein
VRPLTSLRTGSVVSAFLSMTSIAKPWTADQHESVAISGAAWFFGATVKVLNGRRARRCFQVGILFQIHFGWNKTGFWSKRGHAGKKLLEAVADEQRLYFNDELRRHSKLAEFFDFRRLGHEM